VPSRMPSTTWFFFCSPQVGQFHFLQGAGMMTVFPSWYDLKYPIGWGHLEIEGRDVRVTSFLIRSSEGRSPRFPGGDPDTTDDAQPPGPAGSRPGHSPWGPTRQGSGGSDNGVRIGGIPGGDEEQTGLLSAIGLLFSIGVFVIRVASSSLTASSGSRLQAVFKWVDRSCDKTCTYLLI
jgi:hypothetical protein